MNSLEYQLDDPGEITKDIENKKSQKIYIIIISLLILIVIILAALFIIELIRAQNLSDDKDDLNKEIINLKQNNTNLNNDITNLNKEISDLKKNNTNLNNNNTNLNNDITNLKKNNTNLNNEISNLNNDITNLKIDQENLKKENDNLIRKNEILKYNISIDVGPDLLLFIFGKILANLSYSEDNVIINSFVKNGNNFFEELGEMNNGKNYTINERNVYDLYIPSSVTEKKDKYNRIILFIHGGAWIAGEKEQMEFCC